MTTARDHRGGGCKALRLQSFRQEHPNFEGHDCCEHQEVLERHIPPGTGNPDDVYDVFKGRITNPSVHIALNQLRHVVTN